MSTIKNLIFDGGISFAKNSSLAKSVAKGKENVTDQELALNAKKTKAYKENAELKKAVDEVLAAPMEAIESPQGKAEAQKETRSARPGEPRRW